MQVGFFFWPYTPELCERLAERADRYGYAMIGIADTPGNAMDPWVSAAIVARACRRARVAICVTNLISRHPAVSAAAIASLDHLANGRAVLGIGAGHSGTKNVGLAKSRAHELADGVFINYGLGADNIRESRVHVVAGAKAAGRAVDDLEIWQIAALDCNEDRDAARNKVGVMLAFLAGYVIGDKHLATRGVPEALRAPLLELHARYSTRPGDADIKLVQELGLFDYLARRLSICGNPEDCLAQARAAKAAGAERLMLTVSLASDPVRTVELFGEHVLPNL